LKPAIDPKISGLLRGRSPQTEGAELAAVNDDLVELTGIELEPLCRRLSLQAKS
jgi:hypothetical protein